MSLKIDNSLILKQIKSHYGIKKDAEFAKFLDIPPSTLSSWMNRNSFDYQLLISKCVEIDANWLLTGKGEMLRNSKMNDTPNVFMQKTDNVMGIQQIPLYSLEATAGIVQLFKSQYPTKDFISIPNLPKCDGALYVNGDSMYPLLKSGDIVMYKQIQDITNCIFIWGEIYLISFNSDGDDYSTVKYIQKSEKGDAYIKLVSQNSHHQPLDLPIKNLTALALVKASIRINAMN